MAPGDVVVWTAGDPWLHGVGTVVGVNEIGWIEVLWTDHDLGAYPAQHLELAEKWEREQVEAMAFSRLARRT